MIRLLAPMALLALAACATDDIGPESYALGRGLVTYDELRRATDKCKAEGGEVRSNGAGGDTAQLSNYLCVIPKKPKP